MDFLPYIDEDIAPEMLETVESIIREGIVCDDNKEDIPEPVYSDVSIGPSNEFSRYEELLHNRQKCAKWSSEEIEAFLLRDLAEIRKKRLEIEEEINAVNDEQYRMQMDAKQSIDRLKEYQKLLNSK